MDRRNMTQQAATPSPLERSPSDRFYTRLHWLAMGVIALLLLHGFVISRFISTPRGVGFRLFILNMLCFNVLWWSIADRRFARFVASAAWSRALRASAAVFSLLINVPVFYMVTTGRVPQFLDGPTWYAAAVTIWHIGLVLVMPIVAGLRLIGLGVMALARRLRAGGTAPSRTVNVADAASAATGGSGLLNRRALLKTAFATGPMAVLVGATGVSRAAEGRFVVRRHQMAAPWLPDRLRGLKITHISDLHVGRLYRPYMLGRMIDAVNDLDSDIVLVTGDIIDNSNDMLPPAVGALGMLNHRHGIYLAIGNHDMIDGREAFIRYTSERLPLLINQRQSIEIGGERLTIAGLDYARSRREDAAHQGDLANAGLMLEGYDREREGPVIALAHHPHAWDVLAPLGVPLTLSGHTHGGQIMFTPPDDPGDLGLGRFLFRYIRGFYEQADSSLFVNSGVGNWFPLRINAPAEVVQIQLV